MGGHGVCAMKNLVPGGVELSILGALAVVCAGVVALVGPREEALLSCGFTLLLVSMLLGARKAGHLSAAPESHHDPAEAETTGCGE